MEQGLTLRQHSTGLIATLKTQESAREFERGLTIQKIVKTALPICEVMKHAEPREVKVAIDMQLTRLVASLNVKWNLSDQQIRTVVEDLIERYSNETIEDFVLVFKKARQGDFGEIYRLDSAVVFGWMKIYLDEKYQVIEDDLKSSKTGDPYFVEVEKQPINLVTNWLKVWHDTVQNNPVGRWAPQMTPAEINAEGQEGKPKKQMYPSTSQSEVRKRELHLQWIRENFDARTGEKLDDFVDEIEWLKTNR